MISYLHPVSFIAIIIGPVLFTGWVLIAVISLREKEYRAFRRSLLLAIITSSPFLITVILPDRFQVIWSIILLSIFSLAGIILSFPTKSSGKSFPIIPDDYRFDERETMFSRAELQPGSKRFNDYYTAHPAHKITDDRFRRKPGLLSPKTAYYHPEYFKKANTLFDEIAGKRDSVDGPVNPEKQAVDSADISRLLKEKIKELGAHSVGITTLKPYHFYSVSGRGDRYGKPVDTSHQFAIALTVEMNFDAVAFAPKAPTVSESARQYLNSGLIALKIAEYIRSLGYPARAHIDGNYLLICPLVARDAGLGEIGRMGLLMTPKLGPRVRIAVITTELPLTPDAPNQDSAIEDFCHHCRKCAVNCPAGAIPTGKQKIHNGIRRWKINDANCYNYWCSTGTDCAVCMRVCPYSHPNTFFHNLIRAGIRNSFIFRRFALSMDDLLYGKKPPPRKMKP